MTVNQTTADTGWNFDNSYARLPALLYTSIDPSPVRAPKLIVLNETLATSLGLRPESLRSEQEIEVLAGNRIAAGAEPIAQAYAGHQFGHFTMLGDGRAILLGEQLTPQGERFDIQLKGSGVTPYSRNGDGRAALGPMLREYIISEAMHALGIPTTRSLAVVATGQRVLREEALAGAILTRVAASHIRVGTFQYAARLGDNDVLRTLADYTIARHYPTAQEAEQRYLALLNEVIRRQASLIAKWMLVGFIHGVMNTDNMAISGETIDYGPCAFMDTYRPSTVFSSIDSQGRYAYGNQPPIAVWNLARFAESLLPLLHEDEEQAVKLAEEQLAGFKDLYQRYWLDGMRAKLGLFNAEAEDEELFQHLLQLMESYRADYTNTFLALTFDLHVDGELQSTPAFDAWKKRWQDRLSRQEQTAVEVQRQMQASNPAVIPRNHRVEEVLRAAVEEDDFSKMDHLLHVLSTPYAHTPDKAEYAKLPPDTSRPYRTYCGT